jgi:hypothetical protein
MMDAVTCTNRGNGILVYLHNPESQGLDPIPNSQLQKAWGQQSIKEKLAPSQSYVLLFPLKITNAFFSQSYICKAE